MSKPRAVVRQWTLLRLLAQQQNGLSISEMAKGMAVNERTIRRDINLFVQAGVPLREIVGRRGKKAWRVDNRSTLTAAGISVDEALVLVVAEQLLASLNGTHLFSAAQRCREKITASLSSRERANLEQCANKLRNQMNGDCVLPASLVTLDSIWQSLNAQHQ